MKRLQETITVNNEKALSDALREQYGKIILEGAVADSMQRSLEKYRKKQKIRGAAGIGMIVGLLFWPLFLASCATALITSDDLDKYRVECTFTSVTLTHKKVWNRERSNKSRS